MNLRDLEYLVALADHRHFGRAAAACYVSQPTLSTQIKKLETELGVPLVERGSRSVLLTPAGAEVVVRARHLLDDADQIRRIAKAVADPEAGVLRLGLFPTLAPYLLPHVMDRLRARFPRLELLLVEEKSPALIDQLRSGALDAAVLATPVGEDGLICEPVFQEDFLLAIPPDHRLAHAEEPLPVDVLSGQELLLLEDGHCLREQALDVCARGGGRERGGFRATSLETLRHMVATGAGLTLLPRLSVSAPVPAHPGVVLKELAAPTPHRQVALVRRATHVDAALLGEVAQVLRDVPHVTPLS
ncbi:Hydrogen peroxide-inducible genes activator [Austwickia sp. TVS 96-490-7B]|uniref:LysR substrate-binding domain-containing protein n=1 Tax=Austwickia sp. TVS 96-490-7B TaxID=2830843 RepID=UPI001C56B2FC|nr:LysR substrate-binding domain-containing protein [Austwickia sp. TVS 96-490-7B]MBW3086667.1 Hydrogen peroxide-inducible genes activator [Austwickia sp. TVS 96-490-7B]